MKSDVMDHIYPDCSYGNMSLEELKEYLSHIDNVDAAGKAHRVRAVMDPNTMMWYLEVYRDG